MLTRPEAEALVAESEARLWTPKGREELESLHSRGLTEETIRRHRLGWTRGVMLPTADGLREWRAGGIVILWFDGDRLALVKIRQPKPFQPKYAQAFTDHPVFDPGPVAIEQDRPLVIAGGGSTPSCSARSWANRRPS